LEKETVCFFNGNKAWGGGEKWHLETARYLNDKNYKVLVYGFPGKEFIKRAKNAGLKVHPIRVSNLSFLNPFKIWHLVILFKKHKVGTVVLNLSSDMKYAGIAAKWAGIKNIIYRRGLAIPVKNNLLNRFLINNIITKIISNSFDIKKNILDYHPYLISNDKLIVIYNGVEPLNYKNFKKQRKKNNEKIILGNVGRLVEQKAQHYLIDLAVALKSKGYNFEIQIVGSGNLEKKLKAKAKSKGVDDKVLFLGFQENLVSFYQDIDIFILTSVHEGTSNAFIEAMAWRNPVIAFRISSLPEMVENGKNGFLTELGNMESLLEKTGMLIENHEFRSNMGEESYKMVCEKFNKEKNLQKFLELLA